MIEYEPCNNQQMEKYIGEWPGVGPVDLNVYKRFKPSCIINKDLVRFKGDSETKQSDLLVLQIERCTGEDCKNENEI